MLTKKYYDNDLNEIINCLNNDGVVGVNTDTVMGLSALSTSEKAFDKLIAAKNRPANKLFPIMVSSLSMMEEYLELDGRAKKIVSKFLPGELTLVLNKKANSNILIDSNTVAVRIVNDELLIKIVEGLNKPIFLTSANKSNEPTSMYAKEVYDIFNNTIEAVVMKDASAYEASTIVDLTGVNIKVLREGKISLEDIENSLED